MGLHFEYQTAVWMALSFRKILLKGGDELTILEPDIHECGISCVFNSNSFHCCVMKHDWNPVCSQPDIELATPATYLRSLLERGYGVLGTSVSSPVSAMSHNLWLSQKGNGENKKIRK
jgi:hypothetical protein